jgi:hypothetical protein
VLFRSVRNETLRGPLGSGAEPSDTDEVGHRIEHVVAANFLGRVGFKCRNLLGMGLAVGRVYPNEGGDLEFGRNVGGRTMSYGSSVELGGRLAVVRDERHGRGDLKAWELGASGVSEI